MIKNKMTTVATITVIVKFMTLMIPIIISSRLTATVTKIATTRTAT